LLAPSKLKQNLNIDAFNFYLALETILVVFGDLCTSVVLSVARAKIIKCKPPKALLSVVRTAVQTEIATKKAGFSRLLQSVKILLSKPPNLQGCSFKFRAASNRLQRSMLYLFSMYLFQE
jgi:hypothetical protein